MPSKHIADASTLDGWRKSSHSSTQGGSCLEVLDGYSGGVPVRDSKDPHGPALIVSTGAWGAFMAATKNGEFSP
ncbi:MULTISPECIES: DUF397 domain-containing protein [unclassified Streptomyces]|uniref:DUF397 domain-containing protein n=1 Tax=Streptomyces sp. NPDC056835 TaxID=3345956 RepID=UPI00368456DF